MPESPEIFYLKEKIKKKIKNKKILELISNTKTKVNLPKPSKVIDVDSKGKILWIETQDYYIHFHMMISGWLVFEEPRIYKYKFVFDNTDIYIDDRRRFSKVKIFKTKKDHLDDINKLGIDLLRTNITEKHFSDIILSYDKNISALLLDQTIFSGIGNYIRNEALYLAHIHPKRKASSLNDKEINKLYEKLKYVIFSNLYEMLKDDKLDIPKDIKSIAPKNLQYPYKYRVYEKEKDPYGNKVSFGIIAGRKTYFVSKIQK